MLSTPVYPNLAGVITLSDVKQKGSGSYAADYVPWAKVMMLLNEKANGWLPELVTNDDGGYVHKAPNGTGYLCIQFNNGNCYTPVWIYAVMDNRNNAIAYDKISARDLADSARRGICSAAAAFFSLAYELWARDEVAANTSEKVETQPEIQLQQEKPAPVKASKKKEQPSEPLPVPAETVVNEELIVRCMELIQQRLDRTAQVAWIADKATKWNLDGDGSKLKQMSTDQLQACIDELSAKPALKQ
ncbi:MAG: hypothetical protein ACO3CH_09280 [Ilumatobacteraceae bacterium]